MIKLAEIEVIEDLNKRHEMMQQWGQDRGFNHSYPGFNVMHYIERLEARQQDLEQACILALSIFVNQEDIDKFPVLHQELKTVLAQHKREEAR